MEKITDFDKLKSKNYRTINYDHVKSLAESIMTIGLKEPVRVMKTEKDYYIISGHHRVEAFKFLKKNHPHLNFSLDVEIVKGSLSDLDSASFYESSIIANALRSDLNILDRTNSYKILSNLGYSNKKIASMLSKSPSHIDAHILISKFNPEIIEYLKKIFEKDKTLSKEEIDTKIKDSTIFTLARANARESMTLETFKKKLIPNLKNSQFIMDHPDVNKFSLENINFIKKLLDKDSSLSQEELLVPIKESHIIKLAQINIKKEMTLDELRTKILKIGKVVKARNDDISQEKLSSKRVAGNFVYYEEIKKICDELKINFLQSEKLLTHDRFRKIIDKIKD